MITSEASQKAASAFLGIDVHARASEIGARLPIAALDVPETDAGLRLLAANGDWSSVVALASKLEDEAADRARAFTVKGVVDAKGNEVRMPQSKAAVAARLPYVLVQVTAYFKMQRVGSAKKLLDTLGDLEGDEFIYPATRENFAPFSLRFLGALVPFYLSVPKQSQRVLYALLAECERKKTAAAGGSTGELELISLWRHRESRVLRALIYLHFSASEHLIALQLFNKLIEQDGSHPVSPAGGSGGSSSATATVQTTPQERVRRVLKLQQFACQCLHCGNLFAAQQLFEQADRESANSTPGKETEVMQHIARMNEAFTLAFYGRFGEAADKFRQIAVSAEAALRPSSSNEAAATAAAATAASSSASAADAQLLDTALQQIRANAQTSEVSCLPYCQATADPFSALDAMIATAEAHLRRNPQALSLSDAFVAAIVRLYTLSGDRKASLERLAAVLEVLRCDAASLPSLEKMV